jgi:hypothetical protein
MLNDPHFHQAEVMVQSQWLTFFFTPGKVE